MRCLIPFAAMMFATFALIACSNVEEPKVPSQPDVASNFNQPLDARGTDPAWGLTIRGLQLTLARPNQPDIVVTAPSAAIQPSQASWTAVLPDGRNMKVSLYASPCSDGPGDLKYSFSAEVDLPDASPLSGCAGPPASAVRTARR
jgi:uncharacterized membrane protein